MLDKSGWVRRISANALGGMFSQAKTKVSLLLLLKCRIYGQVDRVSYFSQYLMSVQSKWQTQELPLGIESQVFKMLDGQFDSLEGYAELFSDLAKQETLKGFEVDLFGPQPTSKALELGLKRFNTWSMYETKSLQDFKSSVARAPSRDAARLGTASSEDAARLGRSERPGPRIYRVWFGTNRRLNTGSRSVQFGNDRSDSVTYGYCNVSIPKYHTIGSIGKPPWQRLRPWRNNQLKVRTTEQLAESLYYQQLQQLFDELKRKERMLLIFLHGYNVSFKDAAIRAAQLGFDLQVSGATAFFSWPSKGGYLGYLADEATIEASEKHISAFIERMCEECGADVVHVIAHSMGNRGLLKSFHSMTANVRKKVKTRLHQVILAAPDVDADIFRDLAEVYQESSKRTTMYVSSKDRAVALSAMAHSFTRAGFTPPVTVVDGIDTIQVSDVDLSFLGHGYVAEARPVLVDMHTLITSNKPPKNRFGLKSAKTEAEEPYWIIRA
jgi:esterase/lipase superfamily enzyme